MGPGDIQRMLNEVRSAMLGASEELTAAAERFLTALIELSTENNTRNRENLSQAIMRLGQVAQPGSQLNAADYAALQQLKPVLQEAAQGLDNKNLQANNQNDKLIKKAKLTRDINERPGQVSEQPVSHSPKKRS